MSPSCTSGRTRRPRAGGARRSTSTACRSTTSIPRRSGRRRTSATKYDVIVFGPGGGQGSGRRHADVAQPDAVEQVADAAEHRHVGRDRRHADRHGPRRADPPARLHREGRRVHRLEQLGRFRDHATTSPTASAPGTRPASTRVVGSLLRTRVVDDASPIVYGIPDNLAMYSNNGVVLHRQRHGGRRRARRVRRRLRLGGGERAERGAAAAAGRPAAARRTTPTRCRAVRCIEGSNLTPLPAPVQTQPWQYALPTDEQLKRNPSNLIPPQFRPRVALRFDSQNTLLVSGLLDGGTDIAQRPSSSTCRSDRVTSSCLPPTRSTGARRSAATRWCSTRS